MPSFSSGVDCSMTCVQTVLSVISGRVISQNRQFSLNFLSIRYQDEVCLDYEQCNLLYGFVAFLG